MAEFYELADEFERLNPSGFALRPTAERRRLRAERRRALEGARVGRSTVSTQTDPSDLPEDKKTLVKPSILSPTNTVSIGVGDSCIWENNYSMAAIVTQLARFCGEVSSSNPEKAVLEQYDVSRWLNDVEARITSLKITGDAAQIKEAWVLVNQDHGNARHLLHSALFEGVQTFEEFKRRCNLTWRPKDKGDPLVNLHRLMSTPRVSNSHMTFIADIANNISQVDTDIKNSGLFDTRVDNGVVYVCQDQILRYFGLGVIYKQYSNIERGAMKRVKPDPKETLLVIADKITEEITRSNTSLEQAVFVANDGGGKPRKNTKKKNKKKKQHENKNKEETNTQGKEETTTKGSPRGGYFRGSTAGRGRGRGLGRGTGSTKTECDGCSSNQTTTGGCKWHRWCDYCDRRGHTYDDCYKRQRDEEAGRGARSRNTYTASEVGTAPKDDSPQEGQNSQ